MRKAESPELDPVHRREGASLFLVTMTGMIVLVIKEWMDGEERDGYYIYIYRYIYIDKALKQKNLLNRTRQQE